MLVTSSQPVRRLILNLLQTFVSPWVSLPLAAVILAFAAIGLLVMLRGSRRGLTLLGAMAVPYALFHLAFQENETVRYAMPLVPAVVYLAIRGVDGVLRRAMPLGAAALVAASAIDCRARAPGLRARDQPGVPSVRRHARGGPDRHAGARRDRHAPPRAHRIERAREWTGDAFPWPLLPAPVGHEWLELVKFWRERCAG